MENNDNRFVSLSKKLQRSYQEKKMMLAEIQMLKQQLRQGSSFLKTDNEKDALNNLIEANVRSGMMTCVWCLKSLAIKLISPHFHKWKTTILIIKSHDGNTNTNTTMSSNNHNNHIFMKNINSNTNNGIDYNDNDIDDININSPVLSKAYELMERLQKSDYDNDNNNNNIIRSYENEYESSASSSSKLLLSASKDIEQKREDLLTRARMLIDNVNDHVLPIPLHNTNNENAKNSNDNTSWQDIMKKFNIGNKINTDVNKTRGRARSHSPSALRSKSPSFMAPTISYRNHINIEQRYNDDNNSKSGGGTIKSVSKSNSKNSFNDYNEIITTEWKAWSNNADKDTFHSSSKSNYNKHNDHHVRGRSSASPSYLQPTRASLQGHSMLSLVSSSIGAPPSTNTIRRSRSTTPTNNRKNYDNDTNMSSNLKPRPLNMELASESDNNSNKVSRSRSTTPTSQNRNTLSSIPKLEKAQLKLLFGHLIESNSSKGDWATQLRRSSNR